ncbi:class A beta-lactamase-related serine hydrolase [Aetokthonos hydrillicola Thurmond2011]|jgi:beta-lactamase class A|uniref:Class A beta-lactamase-related serine hydrolase n=2 Tax=Aetokthonos TaxID=1550243 RepID=A0AAP5IH34_9CYAN|nr:serine hydrolase [Aetokthonos hydrillicola]MBW4585792.1 class A beta-lactamase-related serine hydrolase [Aetokthonos hydrillicola CCALA 1050]MDR9899295.1 class A beta-lactamase-related serine hydrolase [Aetokthonos hydrillicola Thurmond2011]
MTNWKFFPFQNRKSQFQQHVPKPRGVKPQKKRIIRQPNVVAAIAKGTSPSPSQVTIAQSPKTPKSQTTMKPNTKPKFRGGISKVKLSRQSLGLIRLIVSSLIVLILVLGMGKMTQKLQQVVASAQQRSILPIESTIVPNPSPSAINPSPVDNYSLNLTQELIPLKAEVQSLADQAIGLKLGAFFVNLDNGTYLDVNASDVFAAASMIKFPILVAFFQDIEAGLIHFDEKLTLTAENISRGNSSGIMQYKRPGTKFTALETATKMITISDNTATNMLISRMGGAGALNQRFQSWGLKSTQINNLLPDLSGTNTTTPLDLAHMMALVNHGNVVSSASRERLLDIMKRTTIRSLLPAGLGPGATIAHKTGDIGSLVGDVGLVTMLNGKSYIGVAMVQRPHNDKRAQKLIRQVSRAVYQQFSGPESNFLIQSKQFKKWSSLNLR